MKPVRHCDADDVLMLLFLSANVIFLFPRNLPCVLFDDSDFFLCFPLTNFSDRFRQLFTIFVDLRVFSNFRAVPPVGCLVSGLAKRADSCELT